MVPSGTKGKELDFPITTGGTRKAFYHNTTREDIDQFYTYMWEWQCAYTKWTPTNQYLDKHMHTVDYVNDKSITLSRFGFVGWDMKCYWGLFGVQWVKPLPVYQELSSIS